MPTHWGRSKVLPYSLEFGGIIIGVAAWMPHGFRQAHGSLDIAQHGPYCATNYLLHGRVVVVMENHL
jgi:hypothetical protein